MENVVPRVPTLPQLLDIELVVISRPDLDASSQHAAPLWHRRRCSDMVKADQPSFCRRPHRRQATSGSELLGTGEQRGDVAKPDSGV